MCRALIAPPYRLLEIPTNLTSRPQIETIPFVDSLGRTHIINIHEFKYPASPSFLFHAVSALYVVADPAEVQKRFLDDNDPSSLHAVMQSYTKETTIPIAMQYLAIYEQNRVYGGPEEGGWWYDAGVPELVIPIHGSFNNEAVMRARSILEARALKRNQGRNSDISSVVCDGHAGVELVEFGVPLPYPLIPPRYS